MITTPTPNLKQDGSHSTETDADRQPPPARTCRALDRFLAVATQTRHPSPPVQRFQICRDAAESDRRASLRAPALAFLNLICSRTSSPI